jgi:hypothetical protein
MFIEDIIISLTIGAVRLNSWDHKVVSSFYGQICSGSGFTEKQCTLAIRIIKRYNIQLSSMHNIDIAQVVETPKYRLAVRKSTSTRSIRIVPGNEVYDRLIEVRFPYDEPIIAEIRNYRSSNVYTYAAWHQDNTSWMLSVSEENIIFLTNLFKDSEVEADEEFKDYQAQISKVISNMEQHVPMLCLLNDTPTIVNASKSVPEIETTDILGSVFKARMCGINHWDQNIDSYVDTIDPSTKKFLKSKLNKKSELKNNHNDIMCLKNVLNYLGPTLFIVPGGDELKKLQNAYAILQDIGITNKDISVMFRLDSRSDKDFNDFVKDNLLNSPVSNDTKIVFISGKIPKPLIKSKIKFNSIVNLGFTNAHYTLRDYIFNHQDIIFFDVEIPQQGFNFADL